MAYQYTSVFAIADFNATARFTAVCVESPIRNGARSAELANSELGNKGKKASHATVEVRWGGSYVFTW